jgi:PHD/YefM family antitoxin component YafN of YafNO toxin-antitoxin module
MAKTVAASVVAKQFGRWVDTAIREPVAIERHGRETVYLISAEEYHYLRRLERRALAAEEVSDEIAGLIEGAEYGR